MVARVFVEGKEIGTSPMNIDPPRRRSSKPFAIADASNRLQQSDYTPDNTLMTFETNVLTRLLTDTPGVLSKCTVAGASMNTDSSKAEPRGSAPASTLKQQLAKVGSSRWAEKVAQELQLLEGRVEKDSSSLNAEKESFHNKTMNSRKESEDKQKEEKVGADQFVAEKPSLGCIALGMKVCSIMEDMYLQCPLTFGAAKE